MESNPVVAAKPIIDTFQALQQSTGDEIGHKDVSNARREPKSFQA